MIGLYSWLQCKKKKKWHSCKSWVEMIETTIAIRIVANSRCVTIRTSSLAKPTVFCRRKPLISYYSFFSRLYSYSLFLLVCIFIDHYRSFDNEESRQLHSKNGQCLILPLSLMRWPWVDSEFSDASNCIRRKWYSHENRDGFVAIICQRGGVGHQLITIYVRHTEFWLKSFAFSCAVVAVGRFIEWTTVYQSNNATTCKCICTSAMRHSNCAKHIPIDCTD